MRRVALCLALMSVLLEDSWVLLLLLYSVFHNSTYQVASGTFVRNERRKGMKHLSAIMKIVVTYEPLEKVSEIPDSTFLRSPCPTPR